MKKVFLISFVLFSAFIGQSQGSSNTPFSCNVCLKDPNICNAPFFLHEGQSYTFYTDATPGANYSWSVTGGGLEINGPRDQQIVEVKAISKAVSQICLTKSVDGQPPCCICFTVIIDCGKGGAGAECCKPTFDYFYICDDTDQGHGAIVPYIDGCDVSNISSIDWDLGGAKFIAGILTGLGHATMYPPFNQYAANIGYFDCANNPYIRITATYHFYDTRCNPYTTYIDLVPDSSPFGNKPRNISKDSANQITIYPNPSNNKINIQNNGQINYTGVMYNLNGEIVRKINKNEKEISIEDLSTGVYYMKLFDENKKEIFGSKLVKE